MISIKKIFQKQNSKQKLEALEKENSYYQKVAEDLNMGERDDGMWSKAFSRSKGDLKETESNYIKLMVEKIVIEEQLKETEKEERKKEEEKLEKEREEKERLEEEDRLQEERERVANERLEEEDRLREERKKNKQPFLREEELFTAVIISSIIFLFEVNAILEIPTPLFYINFENVVIWDSFFFMYIFVVTIIFVRIIRLFRSL